MRFLQGVVTLVFLGNAVSQRNENCRKRAYAVESGRRCRKTCEIDEDCKGIKTCQCDGACGKTCFNPNAECEKLDQILNGVFSVTKMTNGGKVTYRCDTGYVINGTTRRTCYADKNWHPPAPTCGRGCGVPGDLGNAYPTATKSEFGINEKVEYRCRTGYFMHGDPNRTCLDGGWGSVTYYCRIQVCDSLYEVYKGTISYTYGRNFGSTATLSCDTGYRAVDSYKTSVRCYAGDGAYGEWNGELTSCEIKTCAPPSEPENGSIPNRFSFGRDYGTQISYKCNTGFKLEGSTTGTCDDVGTWGAMPNCTLDPDCGFQDSTQPTCGYANERSLWKRVRGIGEDGLYGYVSECRHRECKLTSAVIPDDWTDSQTVCLKFNYKLLTSESSFEISYTTGHYHPDIVWRSHSQEIPDTWHDSLLNIYTNRTIQYQFEAISPTIQIDNLKLLQEHCDDACERHPCQNSGTCIRRASGRTCFCTTDFRGSNCETDRKCSSPAERARNANLWGTAKIENMLLPDSSATYRCIENYKLSFDGYSVTTSITIHCVERHGNGESYWNPSISSIACVDRRCSTPPVKVTNANLRSSNTIQNTFLPISSVTYDCIKNYKLRSYSSVITSATLRCVEGYGKSPSFWNPSIGSIRCVEILCSHPPLKDNQNLIDYSKSSWRVGENATARCKEGYDFDSKRVVDTRTCGSDQRWSGEFTNCQDVRCPEPTFYIIRGRRMQISDDALLDGVTATYDCDTNYKFERESGIVRQKKVTCRRQWNGSSSYWHPPTSSLRCTVISCSKPQTGKKQYIQEYPSKKKWNIGERATYRCDRGYEFNTDEPQTEIQVICRDDETWDRSVPACREDLKCVDPTVSISNGKRISLSEKPLNPVAIATYQCDDGFKIEDETVITPRKEIHCREKTYGLGSQWEPDASTLNCIPITCSKPQSGRNQYIQEYPSKTKWNIEERATYRCYRGYEFNTDEPPTEIQVMCRDDETWDRSVPACREDLKCVEPTVSISNGKRNYISEKPLLPNATATYECDDGFKMEGKAEILISKKVYCRENISGLGSLWEPDVSTLNCIPIKCATPVVDHNQNLNENRTEWNVGENATYRCKRWYEFASDNPITSITCGNNETWIGEATRCIEDLKCKVPVKKISHGKRPTLSSSLLVLGTSVTYRCDPGYRFGSGVLAERTVKCIKKEGTRPGSKWVPKPKAIMCTMITCANIPDDRHYKVLNSKLIWRPGQNATFSCVEGYELVGMNIIYCKQNAQWSSDFPECLAAEGSIGNDLESTDLSTISEGVIPEASGSPTEVVTSSTRSSTTIAKTTTTTTERTPPRTDIDDCDPNPCQNGGSCKDGVDDRSCICLPGYTGKNCGTDINDCRPNPCKNEAVCGDEVNDFSCRCAPGFSGKTCNIDVDECQENPCLNGATCLDGVNNYACSCVPGYTGVRCGTNINDCDPNPCQNSARCEDEVNEFTCDCNVGYTGKRCETDLDDCDPNPCENGGFCSDFVGYFECRCPSGFQGQTCGIDVDECSSSPCKNHGNCNNQFGKFLCECIPGYTGTLCETADSVKIKLDLVILIPGNYRHTKEVLKDYKGWIKVLGASLIPNYDIRIFLYQYGKTYNFWRTGYKNFFQPKLDIDPGISVSRFESAVHNMSLTDDRIYADFSTITLAGAKRTLNERSRSGSVKAVVILVDRMIESYSVRSIASHVDCLKFNDTNVYFVGVVTDVINWKRQLFKQYIQVIARNIDKKKRQYAVERSALQSVVSDLTRDIVNESLPREQRKACAALPHPPNPYPNYIEIKCHWSASEKHMHAGDKVSTKCTNSQTNWTIAWHLQCKADGSWHLRYSMPCSASQTRKKRSLSYAMNAGCGNPDLPDRAIIINDTEIYRAGTKLILGCLNGFNLTGKHVIKCKASGVWTRTNAACKANRCIVDAFALPPNILIDGDRPFYDTYDAGETATVQCRSPLALHQSGRREPLGRAEVMCVLGGRWVDSIMEFTCETGPTICACPDVPAHAFIVHDPDNYPIGTTLTLECSVGYSPNGQNTITCRENGEWDYPSLQCEESQASICACPDLNANSHIVNDPEHYPVGISVTLACDSGYLPSGGNTISCENNGEWQLPQLHCEEILIDCQTPFLPDQAVIEEDPQEYPPGTTITLDCIGYNSLVGCAQMTCNWTGEWSECESKCEANVCLLDQFITPEGMNVLGYTPIELYNNKFVVGEVATLICSGNRFPFPRAEDSFVQPDLTCQLGGIWQPSVWNFHCIVGCQAPHEPANSHWVREPTMEVYRVGSQISFSCDDGYSYSDVSTVECQDDGTWHEPDDACVDADDCSQNPCTNDGICLDEVKNFSCVCKSGYTGRHCDIDIDDCQPNPCKTGGHCFDRVDDFLCSCTPGFTGKICTIDIDDCDPNPCQNGGSCEDGVNDHSCICLPGYTGKNCGTDLNDCDPNPCLNDGLCFDFANTYVCSCISGYSGNRCEIDIDDCSQNPCQNSGLCVDGIDNFFCSCLQGYTGKTCNIDIDDCAPNPCQNGGLCIDGRDNFICSCLQGYTGKTCSIDIDDCDPNHCMNNATCIDQVDGFLCSCLPGYIGGRCETDKDNCSPNPCRNNASCFDLVNDFLCECIPGFSGKSCESNVNDCMTNPCKNGAVCDDEVNDFSCRCAPGFSGKTCDIDVDECQENACLNNATCLDGINSYSCSCLPGYAGDRCGTNINDCRPNPCKNGAVCGDEVNDFSCRCVPGFSGKTCNIDVDECQENPCLNGATCMDEVNSYTCSCVPGYTGHRCGTNINDCLPNSCKNGAVCNDAVNDFSCRCAPGFSGKICDVDVDECQENPCLNNATCLDGINSYSCSCPPGYAGDKCGTNINDCSPNPCKNGAVCGDEVNDFSCRCAPGFSGKTCNIDINDCLPNPCLSGGVCEDEVNDFSCKCAPGFSGKVCDIDVDECQANPCLNNATCTDRINSYSCSCVPGFTGDRCGTMIDNCNPNPCRHVERCENLINDFHCVCIPGYTGKRCESEIDECSSNPCTNGGHCKDILNGFDCTCAAGYTGETCAIDINDCEPNPCQNSAGCEDKVNDFTCDCNRGYTGKRCETDIDDCKQNICQNGGVCVDGVNSFTCQCPPGTIGGLCQTNLDDCESNPCENGRFCKDFVGYFECICPSGFQGPTCSIDVDECASSPCKNHGNCNNQFGKFLCECIPGYTGTLCETEIACRHPDEQENGYWPSNNQSYSPGDILSLTCNSHFEFSGKNSRIICGFSGAWTKLEGNCIKNEK